MSELSMYAPLLAALCGGLAMLIRKASPPGHLFHTPAGVAMLAATAGVLNAASQWFASGQLTAASLIAGAAGAIAGAAGAMDPTGKTGVPTFTAVSGGKDDAAKN